MLRDDPFPGVHSTPLGSPFSHSASGKALHKPKARLGVWIAGLGNSRVTKKGAFVEIKRDLSHFAISEMEVVPVPCRQLT